LLKLLPVGDAWLTFENTTQAKVSDTTITIYFHPSTAKMLLLTTQWRVVKGVSIEFTRFIRSTRDNQIDLLWSINVQSFVRWNLAHNMSIVKEGPVDLTVAFPEDLAVGAEFLELHLGVLGNEVLANDEQLLVSLHRA
jgi:hypothetical protein